MLRSYFSDKNLYGSISDGKITSAFLLTEDISDNNCVKTVRIWSYSGPYFPVFSPNAGKYGPEKL